MRRGDRDALLLVAALLALAGRRQTSSARRMAAARVTTPRTRREGSMLTPRTDTPMAIVAPLPMLVIGAHSYAPEISDPYGYSSHRGRLHAGVDLTYKRKRKGDLTQYRRPRESSRGGWYFAPADLPVVATEPGRVTSVKRTERGIGVVIAHTGKGRATWYQHLATADVKVGQLVVAGSQLGTMGADPSGQEMIHLHFELWIWDRAAKVWQKIDPREYLAGAPPARVVTLT